MGKLTIPTNKIADGHDKHICFYPSVRNEKQKSREKKCVFCGNVVKDECFV